MFRHQGKSRTLKHNLRIAIILSFVAGLVNVTGYMSFQQLTTNVTGHFALLIYDITNLEFWKGMTYLLFLLSFLFGSFLSSYLIEKFKENRKLNVYVIPTLIESVVLLTIAMLSNIAEINFPNTVACMLLFAMGLQNSYVTKISNAVVRTTHLTGLFTDLGIELAQLLFPKSYPQRDKIKSTIRLRIYIISFFFMGGIVGGLLYSKANLQLNTLILGAVILLIGLVYDGFRLVLIRNKRKQKNIV